MRKKPNILKKSKNYYIDLALFILYILLIITFAIVTILSLFNIIFIEDFVIKFNFAFIGFLLPITKNKIGNLKDSLSWESYFNYLKVKKEIKIGDYIRISYAAFFIIEVDGEYLLLKNSHGMNMYLMPGMTYEISSDEWKFLLEHFHVKNDTFIKRDFVDYRLLVPQNELKKFYRRFCEIINPYTNNNKALMNNIIKECCLGEAIFKNYSCFFKGRYIKKIEFSRYTGFYEMILGDVYEIYLDSEQKEEIRKLKSKLCEKYKFATLEEIKSNGINLNKNKLIADIATNAYDCFDEKNLFK